MPVPLPPPLPPEAAAAAAGHRLLVFDGLCVLCSGSARFVLRWDRKHRFRVTTAQGPIGESLYRHFGLSEGDYETVLLIDEGRLRTESDAALAVAEALGWPWRAAAVLRLVPRALRDRLYRLIARNRFRLFGRRAHCWVPAADQRDRMV